MKKVFRSVFAGLLAILLASLPLGLAAQSAGSSMYVQIKKAEYRDKPSVTGKVLGSFAEGTKLTIVSSKSNYYQVKDPASGKTGWVNKSALTPKVVAKRSSASGTGGASGDEVALATKAFTADVEAQYKKDSKLDYAWVDAMENKDGRHPEMTPGSDSVSAFITEGGLKGGE